MTLKGIHCKDKVHALSSQQILSILVSDEEKSPSKKCKVDQLLSTIGAHQNLTSSIGGSKHSLPTLLQHPSCCLTLNNYNQKLALKHNKFACIFAFTTLTTVETRAKSSC